MFLVGKNTYKFWWNEELKTLKEAAINSNKIWKAAGKPRQGPIFNKRQVCRVQYRKRIREGQKQHLIGPHRSTTYVDAAYSYRPSSVVCRSVGLSVTLVSPAKTAEPIELPFGLRTWVGPWNHVLDEVQIPPWEG